MKAMIIAVLLAVACFGVLSAADWGGDITPPAFVSATAPSLTIDTALAAQTITLSVQMTDDLSGLDYLQIGFVNEFGYNEQRNCDTWVHEDGIIDAVIPCAVRFPRYTAEGRWLPIIIGARDKVGNSSALSPLNCEHYGPRGCERYVYNERATDAIRAMEIQIGTADPSVDPPLFMPLIVR